MSVEVPAGPATGVFYRVVHCLSRDPRIAATRGWYHRREDGITSYLADSVRTCEREIRAGLGSWGWVRSHWRVLEVQVELARVVDLRDPRVRRTLRVKRRSLMLSHRKDIPQTLGRRLRLQGIQGILYESVRDRGHTCLVVFLETAGGGLRWGPSRPLESHSGGNE